MPAKIFTHLNNKSKPADGNMHLSGRKVAVQPNMAVKDWRTEAGSRALKGYVPLENATVVNCLQQRGAYLVGSTKMSELGFGIRGDSSANAVAEGHADSALMTDTMGEVRMAAAINGLIGFKPSYGIVSRFGLIGLVPSMECFGITAKTTGEIVDLLSVISIPDENDFSMSDADLTLSNAESQDRDISGVTLGVIRNCYGLMTQEEIDRFRETCRNLERRGWKIREVELPNFDLFPLVHNVIGSVEASSSCGKFDGVRYGYRASGTKNWNDMYIKSRGESFGLLLKSYLMQGAYFQFEDYSTFENACRIRARLVKETQKLLGEVDMLVLPTKRTGFNAYSAQTISETYEAFCFTLPANVTGVPAVSLSLDPLGTREGSGVQLIGRYLEDMCLLAVAGKISASCDGGN
jgi:aspartyl-tRNA(Asn)/glutamyl-tRNA(Gln) amidotransferase subunit A